MSSEFTITRDEAIKQVVAQLTEPIHIDELAQRVLALWPSKAKNPLHTVRQAIRGWEHVGKTVILLDQHTVVPIALAMQGIAFRVTPSQQEIDEGWLALQPAFTPFLLHNENISSLKISFVDEVGDLIPFKPINIREEREGFFGRTTVEIPVADVGTWYLERDVEPGDSLLITIVDWQTKQFQLVPEPADVTKRQQAKIQARNQAMADMLFALLEAANDERIWTQEAVLTTYMRLARIEPYPGDHWLTVLENDGRMVWDGYEIRYSDSKLPFEWMLLESGTSLVEEKPFSKAQGEQVYQFKAALKYRKGLWRRIEIQGKQTLGHLDRQLKDAFKHDWDHMSGFWKLVRRGQGRRFREIELGHIDPFGEGEAADVTIAGLDLSVDQSLKYVYDFGDWIEHQITLEKIGDPETRIEYPRITEQNKPRYRQCRHCKAQNKKSIATWICIECCNREQTDVLVCEACADEHHSEHYVEEMIY